MRKVFLVIGVLLFMQNGVSYSQTLQVSLSPDKSKVDRSVNNGTATIFFDSNVEDLSIVCTDENPDEPIQKIGNKLWYMHVDAKKDIDEEGICYRNFLLKSPSSAEYYLSTPEIGYNQVLYYTVVLPDKFPTTLSAEYLFSASAYHGVRLSYGGRYGFYVGYKWGNYYKYGQLIDDVAEDVNIANAKELGYIRNSYTAGLRMGLNAKLVPIYLYVGGGYGTYGRQWENHVEVGDNIYFYSDYIKGFEGELGLSVNLKPLYFSLGADALMGDGKLSVDYMLGVGLSLDVQKLFKTKSKIR